jgi:hypothetical protein
LNNQTASTTLTNIGLQVDARVMEGAAFGERVEQGDIELAINAWGAFGGGWHPYNFFSQEFTESDNERQHIDLTSVDVPYPVGNPDGDLETVDVTAKINALGEADSSEAANALLTELAWIYNQYLPRLPLMNGVTRRFLSRDGWEFPETDRQWMVDNPVTNLMRLGGSKQRTDCAGGSIDSPAVSLRPILRTLVPSSNPSFQRPPWWLTCLPQRYFAACSSASRSTAGCDAMTRFFSVLSGWSSPLPGQPVAVDLSTNKIHKCC